MICEAIIHRPKRIATPLGTLGQILYAINPKSIDYILNSAYHLFPDSSGGARARRPQAETGDRPRAAATEARPATGRAGQQPAAPVREPDARSSLVAEPGPRPPTSTNKRKRKHWGWGYADQQPSPADLRRRGAPRSASGSVSAARSSSRSRSRRSSCRRRGCARRHRLREIVSDDRDERVTHALGKAYRDVVRGFRGQFDDSARPRRPAPRRGRGRGGARLVRRRGARRRSRTAAARASSAGSSRGSATSYAGAVTIDLGRARPGARGRPGLARGADPGRDARPAAQRAARRART